MTWEQAITIATLKAKLTSVRHRVFVCRPCHAWPTPHFRVRAVDRVPENVL